MGAFCFVHSSRCLNLQILFKDFGLNWAQIVNIRKVCFVELGHLPHMILLQQNQRLLSMILVYTVEKWWMMNGPVGKFNHVL